MFAEVVEDDVGQLVERTLPRGLLVLSPDPFTVGPVPGLPFG